jgi:dGTPase
VINYGIEKSYLNYIENYNEIFKGLYSKGLLSKNSYFKKLKEFAIDFVYPFKSIVEIEVAGFNIIVTLMNHYLMAALEESDYQKKIFKLLPERFLFF